MPNPVLARIISIFVIGFTACFSIAQGDPCSRFYSSPNDVEQVFVDGGYTYLACGGAGLHILDTSGGKEIELLSVLPTTNGTMGVFVDGDVVYTADGYNGLRCYDVSDRANPLYLGGYVTGQFVSAVVVRNGVAFILDSFPVNESLGLVAVDVHDPATPVYLGALDEFFFPRELVLHGDLALIPDASQGLKVVDISDPSMMTLVSTIENIGGAWSTAVEAKDDLIYISEGSIGIKVYDISTPAVPVLVGLFSRAAGFSASDLLIESNNLYVATYSARWLVLQLDISVPSDPQLVGGFETQTPGNVVDLDFRDGSLYLGTAEDGIIDGDPDAYHGESGVMVFDPSNTDCTYCQADLNFDGVINFFDVSLFVQLYFDQNPIADFSDDGVFDFFDVSVFLSAFGVGCP